MNRDIVIFDRQHYGKPGSASMPHSITCDMGVDCAPPCPVATGPDMGAAYDLDHDGRIEDHEREANLTPHYYLPAKRMLGVRGYQVFVLDQGWYSSRHREARRLAMLYPHSHVVYVACHVNAGGGRYSLVIHDDRSTQGKHIAEELAHSMLTEGIPGIERSITRRGTPTAWTNGLNTIKGIYEGPGNLAGVCFEPYFLDQREHAYAATEEGGERIAAALVRGLINYFANRRQGVY